MIIMIIGQYDDIDMRELLDGAREEVYSDLDR